MTKQSVSQNCFLVYLLLTYYCFGAAMTNEFVEYKSWANLSNYISASGFAQWHTAISKDIALVLVAPMLVLIPLTLLLWRFRPAAIPSWTIATAFCCHAVAWIATTVIQLPVELKFDHGQYSTALMQQLRRTDWIRKIAFMAEAGMVTYMAHLFFAGVCIQKEKSTTITAAHTPVPFTVIEGKLNNKPKMMVKL